LFFSFYLHYLIKIAGGKLPQSLFWIFHLRGKSPDLNRDIDKIIFC
jgi:hypothetical protein